MGRSHLVDGKQLMTRSTTRNSVELYSATRLQTQKDERKKRLHGQSQHLTGVEVSAPLHAVVLKPNCQARERSRSPCKIDLEATQARFTNGAVSLRILRLAKRQAVASRPAPALIVMVPSSGPSLRKAERLSPVPYGKATSRRPE